MLELDLAETVLERSCLPTLGTRTPPRPRAALPPHARGGGARRGLIGTDPARRQVAVRGAGAGEAVAAGLRPQRRRLGGPRPRRARAQPVRAPLPARARRRPAWGAGWYRLGRGGRPGRCGAWTQTLNPKP
jgi:hypothetical protein